MKKLFIIWSLFNCLICHSQTIINPVFERTDTPEFHIDKVEKLKDSILIYCTYSAQAHSWANIAQSTYIEDIITNQKYNIDRCLGLPFEPTKKTSIQEEKFSVVLFFPSIQNLQVFNLIESLDETERSFNIYGVNLIDSSDSQIYSYYDILRSVRQYDFYKLSGNFTKAIEFAKLSLQRQKNYYGSYSAEVGNTLHNLASLCYDVGNYKEAIEYGKAGIEVDKKNKEITEDELVSDYNNMSHIYCAIGDYYSAIEMAKMSQALLIKSDTINEKYAAVLTNLSKFNNCLGNYNLALEYAIQSLNIKKITSGDSSESYAISLSNFAVAKSNLGDFESAISTNKKCYEIFSDFLGKSNILNATILQNISYNYGELGNYIDAINYGRKAISVFQINKAENTDYVGVLANMSLYYHKLAISLKKLLDSDSILISKYYQECYNYLDTAEYVANRIPEKNMVLPQILNNKSNLLYLAGERNKATSMLEQACEIVDKSTMESLLYLCNLGIDYLNNGYLDKALSLVNNCMPIFEKRMKSNIISLPMEDISNYWKSESLKSWINNLLPPLAYYTNDKNAISILYNMTALFAKGFLLNTTRAIKNLIVQEGNPYNIYTLNQLSKLYSELDSLKQIQGHDSVIVNNIKNTILEKESLLVKNSISYRKYIEEINYTWQDVKNKLKDNEAAIEFLKFHIGVDNKILYIALVVKNYYDVPHLIPLFFENEFLEDLPSHKQYELIWKPLDQELAEVTNIYFSPIGILYNKAIEYLLLDTISTSKEYNVFRLSSTRELINKKKKEKYKKGALFGGINYYMHNSLQAKEKKIRYQRAGFESLYNMNLEINEINAILNKGNIECLLYMQEEGSERNFKSLSGRDIDVIHISTHGMYVEKTDASIYKDEKNFRFIINNNLKNSSEDEALSRSFLVMAGGNSLLERRPEIECIDDGILTALEISRQDYHNTDLVVLSACQTGLGEISEDGVLGLQRGFKMAGVNSILMSLDKVDDEATKILMVEFYRNLMDGKTKHQSLKDAQKYLREVDNGKYDNPKYWASFILLDGLN